MTRKHWVIAIAALIVIVIGVCIYSTYDPSKSSFFPKCFLLQLTGYKCPGCGSQRAIHALLQGDIITAWKFNALLLLSIPYLILLLAGIFLQKKYPKIREKVESVPVILTILILVICWWFFRNVFGW